MNKFLFQFDKRKNVHTVTKEDDIKFPILPFMHKALKVKLTLQLLYRHRLMKKKDNNYQICIYFSFYEVQCLQTMCSRKHVCYLYTLHSASNTIARSLFSWSNCEINIFKVIFHSDFLCGLDRIYVI